MVPQVHGKVVFLSFHLHLDLLLMEFIIQIQNLCCCCLLGIFTPSIVIFCNFCQVVIPQVVGGRGRLFVCCVFVVFVKNFSRYMIGLGWVLFVKFFI